MSELVPGVKDNERETNEKVVTRHQDFEFPSSLDDLKQIMLAGEQSSGTNYYEHGKQVAEAFEQLMNLMKQKKAEIQVSPVDDQHIKWRLPKWLVNNQQWIYDALVPKMEVYRTFQIWHDCGKPFVKQLDEARRAHYPDHALVSSQAYLAAGGSAEIASLIENDMVCHHLRSVPETKLLSQTEPDFLALMVTAVCEMHVCQPAMPFGPNEDATEVVDDSCPLDLTQLPGFKIKLKRVEYYGKVMMKQLRSVDSKDH
jgi:hypothetical protein